VGGHAAVPDSPFGDGVRKAQAVYAGREFLDFLAAFTLLYNGMTVTSIELTPLFTHKQAFGPFFYCCTNHGYHILSLK
jgi:hypothetical protein